MRQGIWSPLFEPARGWRRRRRARPLRTSSSFSQLRRRRPDQTVFKQPRRTVPGAWPGIWPVGCEHAGDLRMRRSARPWHASSACSELCAGGQDPTIAAVQRADPARRARIATAAAPDGLRAWRGSARDGRTKTIAFGRRSCCPGSDRRRGRRRETDCRDGRIVWRLKRGFVKSRVN